MIASVFARPVPTAGFTNTNATITVTYQVGQSFGGGVIAYIFQSGDNGYVDGEYHGLIISNSFSGIGDVVWGTITSVTGTSEEIGYGSTNTDKIIAAIGSNSAAGLARSHIAGGKTDWYLPTYKDLLKIYFNISQLPGGSNLYGGPSKWSSSTGSDNVNGAWAIYIPFPNISLDDLLSYYTWDLDGRTINNYRVHPVRNF
jgi:hypothetical protein